MVRFFDGEGSNGLPFRHDSQFAVCYCQRGSHLQVRQRQQTNGLKGSPDPGLSPSTPIFSWCRSGDPTSTTMSHPETYLSPVSRYHRGGSGDDRCGIAVGGPAVHRGAGVIGRPSHFRHLITRRSLLPCGRKHALTTWRLP